jgi:hypothetical protein
MIDVHIVSDLPIVLGPENAIELDASDCVVVITTADRRLVSGQWSFGLGYRVKVIRANQVRARRSYEPYLVARDGRIVSIDGIAQATHGFRGLYVCCAPTEILARRSPKRPDVMQDGCRLLGKRAIVGLPHLHSRGWNTPDSFVEIEFRSQRTSAAC